MKKIIFLIATLSILSFLVYFPTVCAHNSILEVEYDECNPNINGDGEDETWYYLCEENWSHGPNFTYYHLDNNITTIKYFIEDTAKDDSTYTWDTEITAAQAEVVRDAYINSLLEWNNKVYYSYDEQGNRISNRIISIEEGTEEDHNLTIYPMRYSSRPNTIAATGHSGTPTIVPTGLSNITHYHYDNWYMLVNVRYFIYGGIPSYSNDMVDIIRNRTGEHELGHILGLDDVDECCTRGTGEQHHEELLMGYGILANRSFNATYKDIAGISITRGFHSDNDHTWMKRTNNDGSIDLICAQCNGVLFDVELDDGGLTFDGQILNEYQNCIHHGGTNSNMLLVASDGVSDYFKCQNCRHIDSIEITEKLTLNNYGSNINKNIIINPNESMFYKLSSNYSKCYELIIDGNDSLNVKIYDENFNELSITELNQSSYLKHFIQYMNNETYYLQITNLSSFNNSIAMRITSRSSAYLSYNSQNDILLNTYNGIHDYYYINDRGPGFYKFKLTGANIDGTTYSYSTNDIKIYNDTPKSSSTLLEKYSLPGYTNHAENKYNEDSFIVCLSRNGYFYLDINVISTNLASLTIEILPVYSEEIDLFDLSESNNSYLSIMSSSVKGDYFEAVKLNQTGEFQISATYHGSQTEDILFVLAEKAYNASTSSYYINPISVYLMDSYYNSHSITRTLTDGTYYIGYFNKNDTNDFYVSFTRLVTQSGANAFLVDPGSEWKCGSQINIIEMNSSNKSYNNSDITEGFTRIIYMNKNLGLSESRLDYYWYSSNESIATVTNYGTVLGRNAGTVKIMAVSKDDSSKAFIKQFTIIKDDGTGYTLVESNYIIKYSDTNNGLFHLELENVVCPYPWYQYYTWSTYVPCQYEDPIVTNDNWGNYSVSGPGTFDLTGQFYIYNTVYITVVVMIHVTVTNN